MLSISIQDIYGADYFITDVPAEELTHLIYAFANVNSTTGNVYEHFLHDSEN